MATQLKRVRFNEGGHNYKWSGKTLDVEKGTPLLWVIRDEVGLTGTNLVVELLLWQLHCSYGWKGC